VNVRAMVGRRGLALILSLGAAACVGSEATFSGGDAAGTGADGMSAMGSVEGGSHDGASTSSGASSGDAAPSSEAGSGAQSGSTGDGGGSSGDGGGAHPAPSKPGFDITAGGNISKSTGYRLVGAVGESPGGNVVGKSKSYTLKGGVVAGTQ